MQRANHPQPGDAAREDERPIIWLVWSAAGLSLSNADNTWQELWERSTVKPKTQQSQLMAEPKNNTEDWLMYKMCVSWQDKINEM